MNRLTLVKIMLLTILSYNLAQAGLIKAKAMLAQHLIAQSWGSSKSTVAPKPWPWADTYPVAKLSMSRLGIEQYVLAGTEGESLAFGPAWMRATELPGLGSSVIAGHRDTHFAFLQHLRLNDEIAIESKDRLRQQYRVTELRIADSKSEQMAHYADGNTLTLITCYPFGAASRGSLRYVVTATAISSAPSKPLI